MNTATAELITTEGKTNVELDLKQIELLNEMLENKRAGLEKDLAEAMSFGDVEAVEKTVDEMRRALAIAQQLADATKRL